MNRRNGQIVRWVAAIIAAMVLTSPIAWMVILSLTPQQELVRGAPSLTPSRLSLEHYHRVWTETSFPQFVANSCKVSAIVTIIALPLALCGGYALSRFRFRGRRTIGLTLLASQMLPAILLAVPLYATMAAIGLIDTHASLIICYATFALPFSCWMMRGFLDGLPVQIEECAQIDGCSRLRTLWSIVLPISTPGLAAAGALIFLLAWNEYLFAMVFINSEQLKTYPVGITAFISRFGADYGALMASSVIVSVPVVLVFLLLQRHMISGLTAGAVKG